MGNAKNLENLDFEQKRLMLETLDIQVVVDGKQVMIRGLLPIGKPALFPTFPAPANPIGPINASTNRGERRNRAPWLSEP